MKYETSDMTQQKAARLAGITFLVIIIIAIINVSFIDSKLIVPDSSAATVKNILGNGFLFRLGISSILLMYVSVLVLAFALYVLLKRVNKNLALLGLLLRSSEAILGAVTALFSIVIMLLLNGENYSTIYGEGQLQTIIGLLLNLRTASMDIVLIFVGLGGTIFCYLFLKSNYIPRIVSVWGMFTYISMVTLAFISILVPDHPAIIEMILYGLGTLFEITIGLWLLVKGVKIP